MKNKLLLTIALAVASLFAVAFASAAVPNYAPYAGGIGYGYASYGSHPVNQYYGGVYQPYEATPVRIGGFYGQNSAFLIGLKPGFADSPTMTYQNRNRLASNYYMRGPYGRQTSYVRTGGWFGQGYTYNLRGGSYVYTGGKNTASPNYYFAGTF
jgi:hypothetical protein